VWILSLLIQGVWLVLVVTNLNSGPGIPWSVPVMGLLLWMLWMYLRHAGSQRNIVIRSGLRANRVPIRTFLLAILAGLLSIFALIGLWILLVDVFGAEANVPDFSKYPVLTSTTVVIMAALVGALVEESGMRGYFQGRLEASLSGPLAVLLTSIAMIPAHMITQGFRLTTLIFYLCVDVMLGTMAYLTNSILPGIVVHAIGLIIFFVLIWPRFGHRDYSDQDPTTYVYLAPAIACAILAMMCFRWLAKCRDATAR